MLLKVENEIYMIWCVIVNFVGDVVAYTVADFDDDVVVDDDDDVDVVDKNVWDEQIVHVVVVYDKKVWLKLKTFWQHLYQQYLPHHYQ